MSDGVQDFFHLKRRPFSKTIPDALLWMDAGRQRVVDQLVYTVTHQESALVCGDTGVGKTCVLRALRARLPPTDFRLHYIAHVTLGRRDFYRQVAYALGIEPKATAAGLFESIQRAIAQGAMEHRTHSVLILDEAHLMPDSTLGHLHVLANFDWDSQPLLSLIFVGLPELYNRLRLGIHRSLLTRIHTKLELSPTSPEFTAGYVRKRLEEAGAKSEVFTVDGLAVLHEETGGLLRSIDIVAGAALRLAVQEDTQRIDRKLVRRALHLTPLV